MRAERHFGDRVQAGGNGAIRATLGGESGQAFGEVLDLSLKGAAVRIPLSQDPSFFVGEQVSFKVDSNLGSVRVLAAVHARTELDGFRRFGLAFDGSPLLGAKLSAGLLRLFDQRRALRVEPDVTVVVNLSVPRQSFRTTGRMRNVSANGIAVIIDYDSEKALSRVTEVDLEFRLPGRDRPLALQASIRNRRKDDDEAVCIGLCFEAKGSQDFDAQRQTVTDYVVARQSQLLDALMTE